MEGEEEEYFEGGEEEYWEGEEEEYYEGGEEEEQLCVDEVEEEKEKALPEPVGKPEKKSHLKEEIVEAADKQEKADANDHWEMRSRSGSRERTQGESTPAALETDAEPTRIDKEEKERRHKDHVERRRAEVRARGSTSSAVALGERGSDERDSKSRQKRDEVGIATVDVVERPAAEKRQRHTAASLTHPSASHGRPERRDVANGRSSREEFGARTRQPPRAPEPPPPPARSGVNSSQGRSGLMRRSRWSNTAHMDQGR